MKKSSNNTWNFKLLYKSDTDPAIERDVVMIEKVFESFEKKYKGRDFTSSASKLKHTLDNLQELERTINGYKPHWYFHLRKDYDSKNELAQAKSTQFNQRLTKSGNRITFFRLALGKIPFKKQKEYLKSSLLKEYHYLLKVIFDRAKHYLSEGEEQLASLLSQPGFGMWVEGQDKLLSGQTVPHKVKNIPIAEAIGILANLPHKERQDLYKKINNKFKEISHFAEAEINAIYNYKKIMDERRGYKKPYSATVLNYENDEETIEGLVKTVTKGFSISKRFYKLHKKLLKLPRLTLSDRAVKIGEIKKKFNFDISVEIIKKAFAKVDQQYVDMFEGYIKKGQIDVYPRKSKTGGAYCSHSGYNPTFILLNHTNDIRSLETIAHEMGHAFHSELSKTQPPLYMDYTTSTAEVASTFFEQVAVEELEGELSKKDYAILLHNKIMGDISTIFRQIAFFNFELELHERIRKEGQLPKTEIAKIMSKHLRSYMGEAIDIDDEDGYFFVNLSHMRRFFYVYSYAYGQIVSRALFENWKKDESYSKKVEQFLRAGGSMSPKDIFKSIGIDTSDPKFFEAGLKGIERDIDKLEKLTSGKKR